MKKILVISFLFLYLIALTSAGFWDNLGREQSCNMLNLTGLDCEEFWCEEVIGCDYQVNRTACICIRIINNTIIINDTYNSSTTNQTAIDELWIVINNLTINQSGITQEQFDNWSITFRDSQKEVYDEKFDDLWNSIGNGNSGQDISGSTILIIILIILLAGGGFLLFNKSKGFQLKPKSKIPVDYEFPEDDNLQFEMEKRKLQEKIIELESKKPEHVEEEDKKEFSRDKSINEK